MSSRTLLASVSCLLVFIFTPRIAHSQVTTQTVSQECDETCGDLVDSEGNVVGGACLQHGEGEGDGDGCQGTLLNGCTLQVVCLPPIGVGEIKAPDGTIATFCLNVLPEVALKAGDTTPARTDRYIAST